MVAEMTRPTTTNQQQHTTTAQTERAALTVMQGKAGLLCRVFAVVSCGGSGSGSGSGSGAGARADARAGARALYVVTLEWSSADPPAQIDVGLDPDPQPAGHVAYVRVLRAVCRLLWRQEQAARRADNVWAARHWQAAACRLTHYLDDYQAAALAESADADEEAVAYG